MSNKKLIEELRGQVHLAEQMMQLGDLTDLLEKAALALEEQENEVRQVKEGQARIFCHLADARNALEMHHRWHLDCDEPDSYAVPDGQGGWIGLNRAEEYADSSMHNITCNILAKGSNGDN